jgi:hypothetical protein
LEMALTRGLRPLLFPPIPEKGLRCWLVPHQLPRKQVFLKKTRNLL